MRALINGKTFYPSRFPTSKRREKPWMHWYAEVRDPETGDVLWSDDCRNLGPLADDARRVAGAFTLLASIGQRFRPWAEIVDEVDL